MFLINFMPDRILNMVLDWVYQQIVNGLAQFFGTMNENGYNLFAQPWVMAIVQLFSKIGWALFETGIVVAVFEFTIEAQSFGTEPFSSRLRISNLDMYKYDWVWRKPKGTCHLNANKQPMRDSENITVFYKRQCRYNPQMSIGF